MKLLRALCFLQFSIAAFAADGNLPLSDGEQLTYRVAWGIFGNAGEIKIAADAKENSPTPHLSVTTSTRTRGVLGKLFPFQGRGESIFNLETGRLLQLTETSEGGKKRTNTAMEFDYGASEARFTDHLEASRSRTLELPPGGSPLDLIMSLVQTRSWDMRPGDKRDINVAFEKEIYQLTVHALGYERVDTRLGRFKALLLEPRMEKTPPKGMFKRGSKAFVWIAQDDPRRLPVKFEVEFKFGVGVATLNDYQPPGSALAPSDKAEEP
jgi:hypothetical protein